MTRNYLIGGIIIIVLIILGLWYASSMNGPISTPTGTVATTTATSTPATTTPAITTPTQPVTATPSPFKSIFTQSGSHECTYQQVGASTQSTSVVYISGGKMRGEFRTTGSTMSANLMIYSGGYLYTWKEGTTAGKRTSISSLSQLPYVIPNDLTSGAVFGTSGDNVSWDCHDWLTDNSVFTIPAAVKFTT